MTPPGTADVPARGKRKRQRRDARILALQLCYAADQKRWEDDGALRSDDEQSDAPEVLELADAIFRGLLDHRVSIDTIVEERLNNWTLVRMAVIDRSLLRLGCYEILHRGEIPTKVIINEYIELAKIYGSEAKTAKLINAVLDRIAKDHR